MTSSCIRLVWQPNTKTGSAQNPGRLIVGLLLTVKEGPPDLTKSRTSTLRLAGRVGRRAANHGPIDSSGYRTNEGINLYQMIGSFPSVRRTRQKIAVNAFQGGMSHRHTTDLLINYPVPIQVVDLEI